MIRKNLLDYFLRREAKRPLTSESVSVAEFRRHPQTRPLGDDLRRLVGVAPPQAR